MQLTDNSNGSLHSFEEDEELCSKVSTFDSICSVH